MSSSNSAKEFIMGATACVKAAAPTKGMTTVLPEADTPVALDLGNGLWVVYLVEADEGLVYVQNHHLQDAGMTVPALHEIGIVNLMQRSDDKATFKKYGPAFAAQLDGMFEASLILRDDLWDEMMAHLAPNGFVAGLPARDTLIVCDAKSTDAIASLKKLASDVFAEGRHALTPNLYRRQNGKWVMMS